MVRLRKRLSLVIGLMLLVSQMALPIGSATVHADERVSKVGQYSGYTHESFDGWKRSSQYVTVRDGTKLAVDIVRPTKGGALHSQPLPVAWMPKRYQRATVVDGQLRTSVMNNATAQKLVKYGYIVVSVDMRGTGASFGTRDEFSDPIDGWDGYDITEWLAAQPWSDGKIAMFGVSYEGRMQLNVASTAPPHLKAIMPEVSPFDWYYTVQKGGIYRISFESFGQSISGQDTNTNNSP
ncbi:MAG: CocE/NonD family hydrolase, partial [Dehalococcoidia bacterium]|nr:CocE/NonD family hydrolase [Dehalococcoidia bacterium]